MSTMQPSDAADELPAMDQSIPGAPSTKKKKKKRKKSTSDATQTGDVNSSKLSLKKRQFLKKSAKQTPWYDVNELMSTGRDLLLALKLFPSPHDTGYASAQGTDGLVPSNAPNGLTYDEYSQLQAALRRVALWRGRSDRGGRLPHAIDVTAGLAGVLLMDAERSRDASVVNCSIGFAHQLHGGSVSLYQLRNSYSTLLLRSVNGLADTYRHQKKSALLSVAHCCSLAGLPLWIVDVRHDASHNDLPSLGVCRIGALESLKFWKGRYWDALNEKVWGETLQTSLVESETADGAANDVPEAGVHTLAMDCLMKYQKAVEIEAVERQRVLYNKKIKPEKKEYQRFSQWQKFSRQNGEHVTEVGDDVMLLPDDDDDAKIPEDEGSAKKQKVEDAKVNPWWILEDNKPKKKKEKKATEADAINEENTASDIPNIPAVASPSSRECAAELLRTTPVDVLYSTTLQYLVWGGTTKTPSENDQATSVNDGPALLALFANKKQSDSKMQMEDAFEEARVSYEPLIVSIAGSYPGFLSALFVHLVDSIMCLDTERKRLQNVSKNAAVHLNEIEWNIHCLTMWACYLLTREFQMHLDRSVAVTNRIVISKLNDTAPEPELIDLKKKGRKKWTPWEQHFMQSPLEVSSVPLNSVCDRFLAHLGSVPSVPDEQSTDGVAELYLFFRQLLGKNRVYCGISESHCGDNTPVAGATMDGQNQSNVAPWTLCKSWDACAIGTMPGFPA